MNATRTWIALASLSLAMMGCGGGGGGGDGGGGNNPPAAAVLTESYSSPIALTTDDKFAWVVNPDNDSVSVMEVAADKNTRIREIPMGDEPRCVAITPDNKKAYVTNALSGKVYVVDAINYTVIKTINVGVEPFGCALTFDGAKLYVANLMSDNVSVIDTATDVVTKTIGGVGVRPRAIALANVGGQIKVYVTQMLAQPRNDGRTPAQREGFDDGREGRVTVIAAATDTVIGTVTLAPKVTGFKSNGSALDKVVFDAANDATKIDTTAFPNTLESIVVKGGKAYLANTASSPNAPNIFNVNVQGFVSVVDIAADQEVVAETFNMNKGIQFEPEGKKLFVTNPSSMAFKHNAEFEGFAVSAASDFVVRVVLDSTGKPTINAPTAATDPGNIIRIPVGVDPAGVFRNSNPQGIVINSTDSRAYVMNFISRDVSVLDISGSDPTQYKEIARIQSADLPAAGTKEAIIHRGHELFNTSIGPPGKLAKATPPAGRMSDNGWGSCASCHPRGLSDGVTWIFGDGPRQTVSMESTGVHPQDFLVNVNVNANGGPLLPVFHQRALNWSAIRDEIQDFELNIRNVSGGEGLIALLDNTQADKRGAQDPCVFNLLFNVAPNAACDASRATEAATNTGRDPDLDALAAYVAFGIRAPVSPLRGSTDPEIAQGRTLFEAANCQGCHGGQNWTASTIDFTPPPAASEVTAGQLNRFLCKVGTFNAAAPNELKGGGVAGQVNTDGANGALGFNIPSLLSVAAGQPYFHSGDALTLEEVLDNLEHRQRGTGVDTLTNATDRAKLAKFLASIDITTPNFPERTMDQAKTLCLP